MIFFLKMIDKCMKHIGELFVTKLCANNVPRISKIFVKYSIRQIIDIANLFGCVDSGNASGL